MRGRCWLTHTTRCPAPTPRYGYASAATLAMFLITALIVFVQWRIIVRWRHALAV